MNARAVAGLILAASLLASCATSPHATTAAASQQPGIVHVVLLWLKQSGDVAQRQQLLASSRRLADIPGVLDFRLGEVVPGEREVVEDSYDVALMLRFDSAEALAAYQRHPLHLQALGELVPLLDRYRVIDFRDQ